MTSDQALLKMLEQCRAADFIGSINQDGNERKICGVAPLYMLAKVLEGRARGTVLSHSHATVDDDNSFVTFASMAFYEENGRNPDADKK
jgi:predicted class III extradiol MEMO1 family dioxygenase